MSKEISMDLVGETFNPIDISWGDFETQLYALAVGADPFSDELDYVYEGRGPKVLPTYPVVKALEIMGSAMGSVKLNPAMVLHGEQSIKIHRPLKSRFKGKGTAKISQVWDKEKAAVLGIEGVLEDADGPLVTLESTAFIRGAGGFGGERGPSSEETKIDRPAADPDFVEEYTVAQNQAALYRLTGDRNPIHIDPNFAKFGGFDKPFLHGLCTYGIAGRHVVKSLLEGKPERLTSMTGRFSKQVWMGDQVITKIWKLEEGKALVEVENQNGDVVLNQCVIEYSAE